MKKAILYLIAYILIQFLGGSIVQGLWDLLHISADTTIMIITASCVTSLFAIAFFLLIHAAEVSPRWLRTRQWAVLCWCALAALGAIIPSDWLQSLFPELPNYVEEEFDMILQNRWGYLAIGLLAPLAEELVMRGAILRSLLQSPKLSPWGAIVVSALFFALIHFNPVQMPHAFLMGLLLGWMYYRTDSILPGVAVHWVNNTVAYVLYNLYPDPQMDCTKLFGSQKAVIAAVIFSLLILLPAIYQLHLRMKKAE